LAAVPPGWRDCGTETTTSGWPTTIPPRPDRWRCIVTAANTGVAARFALDGRDHRGGVDIVIYDVHGPGDVHITTDNVDPTGTVHPGNEQDCTGLTQPADFAASPSCVRT
jgi:hypothetical protein